MSDLDIQKIEPSRGTEILNLMKELRIMPEYKLYLELIPCFCANGARFYSLVQTGTVSNRPDSTFPSK